MSAIYAQAELDYLENCRTFFQIKEKQGFRRLSVAISAGKIFLANLGFSA